MGNITPSIDQAEHIGDATGDNIEAKRVASYGFGTDLAWKRQPLPLITAAYDSFAFSNADANGNYQTLIFKNGSNTVQTLSLSYDGNSNITQLIRS
jgi:hypothetical protein